MQVYQQQATLNPTHNAQSSLRKIIPINNPHSISGQITNHQRSQIQILQHSRDHESRDPLGYKSGVYPHLNQNFNTTGAITKNSLSKNTQSTIPLKQESVRSSGHNPKLHSREVSSHTPLIPGGPSKDDMLYHHHHHSVSSSQALHIPQKKQKSLPGSKYGHSIN